jgi:hypothetical protein
LVYYFATMAPWGVVLLLLALLLTVPRAVERRRAKSQLVPVPAPEPREPRDTSRPYPRPKGSRSKLNRVCPVCGTGPETGDLDRRLLGWPAHRTCAEWLGDWKPRNAVPSPPKPPGASVQISVGNGQATSFPIVSTTEIASAQEMIRNGLASVDEVREQLDQEIISSWGVPPMMLEEHTHKAGDPAPAEQCPKCGARFYGTPDYLRQAFKMHRQRGCRV